jgi:polyisoprenoid-binding protein YceI
MAFADRMSTQEHCKDACMKRSSPHWRRWARPGSSVALILFFSVAAAAQQIQVSLDPAQTKIDWTLGDVLHMVHGSFKLKSGSILIDTRTCDASGQIVVDAKSGESGNRSRDGKMHKEVLQSARFPEIIFFPKHASGNMPAQGSATLQVTGVFRIHGSDHDLTLSLPVQVEGSRATAATKFDVPYEAWGMKNPSTLFLKVDNKVEIDVSTVATVVTSTSAAAPSKSE